MKKSDILEIAKSCHFDLYEQVRDLSGNTFFSLRNASADFILIYRDQNDGNFFSIGSYSLEQAKKLMNKVKNSR